MRNCASRRLVSSESVFSVFESMEQCIQRWLRSANIHDFELMTRIIFNKEKLVFHPQKKPIPPLPVVHISLILTANI